MDTEAAKGSDYERKRGGLLDTTSILIVMNINIVMSRLGDLPSGFGRGFTD